MHRSLFGYILELLGASEDAAVLLPLRLAPHDHLHVEHRLELLLIYWVVRAAVQVRGLQQARVRHVRRVVLFPGFFR